MDVTDGSHSSRRSAAAGFLVVLLGLILLAVLHGAGGRWLDWSVSPLYNPAFQEAVSWKHGQCHLPFRLWDTAIRPDNGLVYNVFPPLQTLIGLVLCAPYSFGSDVGSWPEFHLAPLVLFGLPLPIVGYWAFWRRTNSPAWAAILTLGWLAGTPVLPSIDLARQDDVHYINHLLSQIGLLIFTTELLGRRRMGVLLAGLAMAAWTRQLTIFYGLALIGLTWRGGQRKHEGDEKADRASPAVQAKRTRWAAAGIAIIVGVPAALNTVRFGRPVESGYGYIYAQRDTDLARAYREHGLFSPVFVPRNAWFMNGQWSWPRPPIDGNRRWEPSWHGASIWLTSPILLIAMMAAPVWWRERRARALMFCSLPVVLGLLLYHGTGFRQPGYYRFALDFVPVWLVVAAPALACGWRRWAAVVCVTWGVSYFALLDRWAVVPT